jgi:hypothetical protein
MTLDNTHQRHGTSVTVYKLNTCTPTCQKAPVHFGLLYQAIFREHLLYYCVIYLCKTGVSLVALHYKTYPVSVLKLLKLLKLFCIIAILTLTMDMFYNVGQPTIHQFYTDK